MWILLAILREIVYNDNKLQIIRVLFAREKGFLL